MRRRRSFKFKSNPSRLELIAAETEPTEEKLFLLSGSHKVPVKNGLGLVNQLEDQRLLGADGAQVQVLDVWEEAAFHLVE